MSAEKESQNHLLYHKIHTTISIERDKKPKETRKDAIPRIDPYLGS